MKYLLRVSLLAAAVALLAPASQAQQFSFFAVLNGPSEDPSQLQRPHFRGSHSM
jgi:hypothetical protein